MDDDRVADAVTALERATSVVGDDPARNFGTFSTGFVQPEQITHHLFGPGYYSLSTLSTCPYASFIGLAGKEKIFSWGEIVHIPPGAAVRLKNASFHAGDVVVNSGRDFSTVPSRVTVPVRVKITSIDEETDAVEPVYPADTRRCRRAYVAVDLTTGAAARTITFFSSIGPSKGGRSHNSETDEVGIAGYGTSVVIPPNTTAGVFPMGFLAETGPQTLPHALLDFTAFVFSKAPGASVKNVYYILEY